MNKHDIELKIVSILEEDSSAYLDDYTTNLFHPQFSFQACGIAHLFIELQGVYGTAVRDTVGNVHEYSVTGIADAVLSVLKKQNEHENSSN